MQIDLTHAKPHPKDRPVEPEDPLNLHGFEVPGDADLMLCMLVEEFARMGWDLPRLLAMFRDPFYVAAHGLTLRFGDQELERRVAQILARCGVIRTNEVHTTPISEQLVQIDLPSQP